MNDFGAIPLIINGDGTAVTTGYYRFVPGSYHVPSCGWECPRCGAVMAPFVTECLHCKPRPIYPYGGASDPAPSITTATGPLPVEIAR